MTINVLIVNKSADKRVKLDIQDRDAEGQFVDGGEVYVEPGSFVETYLTNTRSLRASEVTE